LSITSLSGGGKLVTLPLDLSIKCIVICYGEILKNCKCQIQQPGRTTTDDNINKEDVHTALIVSGIIGKEEEFDEVPQQKHLIFPFFSETKKKLQ